MKPTFNTGTGQTFNYDLTNNINGTMVKVTACGCDKGETE